MRAAARAARGLCSDAGARKEAPGKAAGTRVNAWLARQGVCSRAEADDLIARGLVRIDGEEVALGARVPEDVAARIRVAPEGQRELDGKRTFLLHKPKGIVSGTPTGDEIPAVRLLEDLGRCAAPPEVVEALSSDPDYLKGVAPCGRLDKDSSGLLVLTQSGVVASRLLARKVEKEYLVRVTPRRRITDEVLRQLREGHLQLDRRQLRPCTVQRTENPDVLRFILEEGRNRQIRRMCKLVGLHVVDLGRIRIGDIVLNLKRGEWRTLLPDEKF